MQRIATSNAVADMFGPGKYGFGAGNPAAGVRPTYFSADWCNQVQEEICALPEVLGIVIDGSSRNMLATAVLMLVQGMASSYAADTGAANSCVVTLSPGITVLTDGMVIRFKAKSNNTGPSTLTLNSLGAQPIYGLNSTALQGGEIRQNGYCTVLWNASIGGFILQSCNGGGLQIGNGTQSQHGATVGQVQSGAMIYASDGGAANAYVVNYSPGLTALTDGMVLWFKAKVANTGASTLTVNSLGAQPFVGASHSPFRAARSLPTASAKWSGTRRSVPSYSLSARAVRFRSAMRRRASTQCRLGRCSRSSALRALRRPATSSSTVVRR